MAAASTLTRAVIIFPYDLIMRLQKDELSLRGSERVEATSDHTIPASLSTYRSKTGPHDLRKPT